MTTKTLLLGGGAGLAVAVVGAIALWPDLDVPPVAAVDPVPEVAVVTPDAVPEADVVVVAPDVVEPAETPVIEPVIEDAAVEEAAAVVAPVPEVVPVELTDLRFERDGGFVVSGTAPPNQPVAAMVDGTEVERADVGADGAFFIVGFLGFSDDPRMLSVVSDPDGAAAVSERRFVLAANPAPIVVAVAEDVETVVVEEVPEVPEVATPTPDVEIAAVDDDAPGQTDVETPVEIAQVAAEPVAVETPTEDATAPIDPIAPDPSVDVQTTETPIAQTPEDPVVVADAIPSTPSTPAILAVTEDGVDVVQPAIAADTPPEVMSNVALDTITYDVAGDVLLQGRAVGLGFVQVYVNNTPVSRLPIDEDGTWRSDLPDVDTGVYTLRIDEVDVDGDVVSRIETPFLREDRDDVIEAMAEDVDNPDFTVATRTVQPGATLWAIAEERYGSGVLYVNVFEANKDRIRDPDLIYPGQVFTLPEGDVEDSN